jgi:single-stranded DNA-binding protein
VDGRFRTREYETNDGRKGLSLDVSADQVIGLDRRDQEGTFAGAPGTQAGAPAASGGPAASSGGPAGGFDDTEIDELPF